MLDESCLREWQDSLAPISWCPIDVIAIDLESVVESALFAKHAQRWPVLFDPHGVALKWVCAAEKHLISLHGSVDHSKMCAAVETAAPIVDSGWRSSCSSGHFQITPPQVVGSNSESAVVSRIYIILGIIIPW